MSNKESNDNEKVNENKQTKLSLLEKCKWLAKEVPRDGSRIFLRGVHHYFSTNKPHIFFLKNTSCIRKPQVISEGVGGGEKGGYPPLHPPPRSAPCFSLRTFSLSACFKSRINKVSLILHCILD